MVGGPCARQPLDLAHRHGSLTSSSLRHCEEMMFVSPVDGVVVLLSCCRRRQSSARVLACVCYQRAIRQLEPPPPVNRRSTTQLECSLSLSSQTETVQGGDETSSLRISIRRMLTHSLLAVRHMPRSRRQSQREPFSLSCSSIAQASTSQADGSLCIVIMGVSGCGKR